MNRAVAGAAVACWGGALAIVIVAMRDPDGPSAWWPLNTFLVSLAAVLSVGWMLEHFHVTPRSAYRIGLEAGIRREQRRTAPRGEPVLQLPQQWAVRDGRREPPASSW